MIRALALLGTLLSLSALPALLSAQTLIYSQRREGRTTRVEYRFSLESDGTRVKVVITEPGKYSEHRCDENYNLLSWKVAETGQDQVIQARRLEDAVAVEERRAGQTTRTTFSLPCPSWFENFDLGLMGALRAGRDSVVFWALQPEDLAGYTFVAVRGKTEWITVAGRRQEAVRFHVNFEGFLSMFWGGADFWFRKADAVYLKSDVQGGPGHPAVSAELVSESEEAPPVFGPPAPAATQGKAESP